MKTSKQKILSLEPESNASKTEADIAPTSDHVQIVQRIFTSHGQMNPRHILQLQRTLGNQKVQRLLHAAQTGGIFVQRAGGDTETKKLKVKSVSDDNVVVELGDIDPAAIEVLRLHYEEIPKAADGDTESRETWYVIGKYIYINKRLNSKRPNDANVEVVVNSANATSQPANGGGGTSSDAASDNWDNDNSNDTGTAGNNASQAESNNTSTTGTTTSDTTDTSKPADKGAYIDLILEEAGNKGLVGYKLSKGMLKKLTMTQLDTLHYKILEYNDEKNKDIDDLIQDIEENAL